MVHAVAAVETSVGVSYIPKQQEPHTTIVLFYKYFQPSIYPLLRQHPRFYEEKLREHQKATCERLGLKGRVLIASEGVNGTLSARSDELLQEYIETMEQFDMIKELEFPEDLVAEPEKQEARTMQYNLFGGIDWKLSKNGIGTKEPFPDLKVSIVKEIVSSGGAATVEDVERYGGKHLSPREFHETLLQHPDAILIDVRNTFEYDIGHFVHPQTQQAAVNPETETFSLFDSSFCSKNAKEWKDKKVLMYCTGGIRCEKASAMLKKRGVEDVSQLQGGIHRYLEEFGTDGFFLGRNFVFDQRVSMKPSECLLKGDEQDGSAKHEGEGLATTAQRDDVVIGRCGHCDAPFDELCGSRVCTVCRIPVLVCPKCQNDLREYHCHRHAEWKDCYFTFLEVFDMDELERQREKLIDFRQGSIPRRVRKTLTRQIERVESQMGALKLGVTSVDKNAPRRCRYCMEQITICDGRCWGFWKTHNEAESTCDCISSIDPIEIGDQVVPGPNWNELCLGPKVEHGRIKIGRVVELKTWGSGSIHRDCVVVEWLSSEQNESPNNAQQLYRWGVAARNGSRLYDVVQYRGVS